MARLKKIGEINRAKYAQPPSWEQINEFILESGMSMYHFERFYGIPFNTLTQIKSGYRKLSADFWHFIFEKIKPNYGAGFIDDYNYRDVKNKPHKPLISTLTKKEDKDAHTRLVRVSKATD